jgi:hypothetical protein
VLNDSRYKTLSRLHLGGVSFLLACGLILGGAFQSENLVVVNRLAWGNYPLLSN